MIEVSNNLKRLAQLTYAQGHKLYVVGGYVRNMLLGYDINDIDIAGSMLVDDMQVLCESAGYKCDVINKRLGTLLIKKDSEQYEYTTFRKEVYDDSGKHSPDEVDFVTDPKEDAGRRDFTVNAMFYDILDNQLLDYFDGQKDIHKRVIKTVVDPEIVFGDDGLRILRMVRFTCELGFKIDYKTYKTAKKCAHNVQDISRERILNEIKISINGGLKYHLKNNTHTNIIKYYNNLNLWQYILGPTFKNFHIKTYGRMYRAYVESDGNCRYIAFMCLVLYNFIKSRTSDKNLAFSITQVLGNTGLKDSNKSIKDIYDACHFAQKILYDKYNDFITNENCLEYERLPFEIMNYLALINPSRINDLKIQTLELKKAKIPFSELELKADSTELIERARVNPKFLSKIKSTLFEMCVKEMIVNDKDILIEQAKFLNERLEKAFMMQKKTQDRPNIKDVDIITPEQE